MSVDSPPLGLGIGSSPAIHGGEPILDGTATPVRAVVELWHRGVAIEAIPDRLPHLDLPRVLEALHYYLNHREEIDARIAANAIPEAWSGRRFDPATARVEP